MTTLSYTFIFSLCLYTSVQGDINVNQVPTPDRANVIDDIYLRFYNGCSIDFYVQFPLSQSYLLFDSEGFSQTNSTVFYVHGFTETANSESVKTVASSYLDARRGINFVLVDWSNMAGGDYLLNAAPNTKLVGVAIAAQLSSLVDNGLPLNNVHLIGFSLGGHVVGYAGRELKNNHQKTLRRITSLDPAFPGSYPDGVLLEYIRATDAQFVDIIHTDAGGSGIPVSTGTADFWPNGGTATQPGCALNSNIYCSHNMSWRYYAESVRYPKAFPAWPASSYLKFELDPASQVHMVYMGYGCSSSAKGDYYLSTNAEPPYGSEEIFESLCLGQ